MYSKLEIRDLLKRLDGEPADAIEGWTLECKPWDSRREAHDSQIRQLRESAVCFANARGGTIILGIADRKNNRREAIQGVPNLSPEEVQRWIYKGTDPPILPSVEELQEPEGRLLLVHIPKGIPPHTTAEGVAKQRHEKECLPLKGSQLTRLLFEGGYRDFTDEIVPGLGLEHLDEQELQRLRRVVASIGKTDLAARPMPEFLSNLGLITDEGVTLAAVLLAGKATAIARYVPQHEVIFAKFSSRTRQEIRHDLRGPLLSVLDRIHALLADMATLQTVPTPGMTHLLFPELTWDVVRESILNALIHRDYFLRQSIHVHVFENRVEISSPGGFIGGVTAQNILRHEPERRNPFLATIFQSLGLVDRVGMGVDRIYEELLRLGKKMPRYEADEARVKLTLFTKTHEEFARFVAQEAHQGRTLDLDDLLILRQITDLGSLNRWKAAEILSLHETEAGEKLVSLRGRKYLAVQGRGAGATYRLIPRLSDLLRSRVESDLDAPLDEEAVRLRVQTVLAERGSITNTDIRRMTGYPRMEVIRLMRDFVSKGLAVLMGRGRASRYIPPLKVRMRSAPKGKKNATKRMKQ